MSSVEVLGLLVDPGPSEAALEAGWEDLRYFLYQLPEAGLNVLADMLPKMPNRRLQGLVIEVVAYQAVQSETRSSDLISRLNDRALVQLIPQLSAGLRRLGGQTLQPLVRHPSAAGRAARARALLEGRPFVLPDDIKALAAPVLLHRLTLSAESELEWLNEGQVIESLLARTEAPRGVSTETADR